MIQASIAPLRSMIGRVSSCTLARTRSSDHAALATKCSNDWCLAETRAGAVTAAIGSTTLRPPPPHKAPNHKAPPIVLQWLRPIRMPDHPDHRLDIGREPLLPVLAHGAVSPQTPTLEGTSATHAKSCDFLTQ